MKRTTPNPGPRSVSLIIGMVVALPLVAACADQSPFTLDRRPIIGGTIDDTTTSVVALTALGSQFCSGTVIAPRAILTAGHCLMESGIDPTVMVAFFGTTVGQTGAKVRVIAGQAHPQYYVRSDGAPMYDVAVLTLEEDAPAPSLPWQRTTLADPTNQTVTLVGYGVTNAQTQTGNGTRRTVDEVVTSMDDDFIYYGGGVSGTCQGDSGGPMFLTIAGVPTLIGTTSFGDQSCVAEGANTRVDKYADFITSLAPLPVQVTLRSWPSDVRLESAYSTGFTDPAADESATTDQVEPSKITGPTSNVLDWVPNQPEGATMTSRQPVALVSLWRSAAVKLTVAVCQLPDEPATLVRLDRL